MKNLGFTLRPMLSVALAMCLVASATPAASQFVIIGIDNKVFWDSDAKPVLSPPGKDAVIILDISDRMNPRIVASLALMNSVFGPPVNLAITPDESLALVANSMDWVQDGAAWKGVPGSDMLVGLFPYNLGITPNGKLALTANNGNSGAADGNVDTVGVIDLEATPPRVIDQVVVGDGPEGFAISPTGEIAVAILLRGSNAPQSAFFYHPNGSDAVLKIAGKKVRKVGEVEVRGLPEGAVFSPDGKYLYVGNYMDDDISILRVDGTTVTNTGRLFKLPGHPASMRSVVP